MLVSSHFFKTSFLHGTVLRIRLETLFFTYILQNILFSSVLHVSNGYIPALQTMPSVSA
jgi:hypothetical protein